MDTLASLSNEELLAQLPLLCSKERQATANLIVSLAEVERRKLYLREACSSLYTFCVERLGYSEDAAMKRMRVARLYLTFPKILDELTGGAIHLTGLFLLSNHLTDDNVGPLLAEARGKTRREIEAVIARWFPKSDVLPSITPLRADFACPGTGAVGSCAETTVLAGTYKRGIPGTGDRASVSADRSHCVRDRVQPLSAQTYRVEFTASSELHAKLEHARNLLSHAVTPEALGEIFERALDALIAKETKRRQGVASETPRESRPLKEGSRHIPVTVAREVWNRDNYQCAFVDEHGRRCGERRYVTVEHVDPHARGGPPTAENLCLLCQPHNQDAARREFGEEHVWRKRREAEAYSKTAQALVASGFQRKQVNDAVNALRKRGAEPEVEGLLRQALVLLCPSTQSVSRPERTRADD